MRGIREGDNRDRPNILLSLLLRKSQTVPAIYFGKYQKLVNWNTRWSTCSPSGKGKLRAEVCLREASQIIIYGWRSLHIWCDLSKYLFLVLILMKNTWGRLSRCHCREQENDPLSHKGSQLQSYRQVRPVNSVLSKQLVISFASKKTDLSREQARGNSRPIEVIRHHIRI